MADRHRVVVVGGGFGGLNAVRGLDGVDVDVTLVDRTNHHLFQPLLYQVATGILSPGQIAPVLRHILRRHRNVRVEIEPLTEGTKFWAFMSITNNKTQQFHTITPR